MSRSHCFEAAGWLTFLALFLAFLASIADPVSPYRQGDRVILVNPGKEWVKVGDGPDRSPVTVDTGTRGMVVRDDGGVGPNGEPRRVKVRLVDSAHAGLSGTVSSDNLKPE